VLCVLCFYCAGDDMFNVENTEILSDSMWNQQSRICTVFSESNRAKSIRNLIQDQACGIEHLHLVENNL
jgi:hypothetical protein